MQGITEAEYELALIELFQNLEGNLYHYEYGPDIERGYTNPIIIGKTTRYPQRKTKCYKWKNEAYNMMCVYTLRFLHLLIVFELCSWSIRITKTRLFISPFLLYLVMPVPCPH